MKVTNFIIKYNGEHALYPPLPNIHTDTGVVFIRFANHEDMGEKFILPPFPTFDSAQGDTKREQTLK